MRVVTTPGEEATRKMLEDFRREVLQTINLAFSARSEWETPQVPVEAVPLLGENAPGQRPGKEVPMEVGERDVAARELFPGHRHGKEVPAEVGEREAAVRDLFPGHGTADRASQPRPRDVPSRQAVGESPFCELIISALVPEGFREPDMSYYSGKDDPVQHVQWFEDVVSIRQMTDAFKCRLFAITLKEKARDWFHQLPASSIYSFEDLRRGFLLRFSTSKKQKKEAECLFAVRKKQDETLGHYVDRFQEEILLVQEVPGYALMLTFTLGLKPELMERTAKEIDFERANPAFARKLARLAEDDVKEPASGKQREPREERRREEPRRQGQNQNWGAREPHNRLGWRPQEGRPQGQGGGPRGRDNLREPRRFDQQAWRQGPRDHVSPPQEAMEVGRGRGGRRGVRGAGRRGGEGRGGRVALPFCDFHQEEGHATATCPEFLEMREARGMGRQDPPVRIVEVQQGGEEDRCEDRVNVGTRGGIRVIHGGVGIEATRKGSLQTMFRRGVASTSLAPPPKEKIIFSSADMPDYEDPFCDALVIQTAVENFTVSRILVDNGSSVNVIFKRAFDEMKVEGKRVLASDGPLFGFSGERKEVEGGFNNGGVQVRIRGDPKVARQCYVTAVNTVSWMAKAEELERELAEQEEVEPQQEESLEEAMEVEEKLAAGIEHEGLEEVMDEEEGQVARVEQEAPRGVEIHQLQEEKPEEAMKAEGGEELEFGEEARMRIIATKLEEPIREEVRKLLEAGFISEVQYPGWISNVVMVKKGGGKEGCFSYKMMPFGLKNAGATYQRMMDRVFQGQRGRNLEVYVDDLMVKSKCVSSHLRDLEETFVTLRRFKMRLNPLKCVFGASRGKFLGHLLTPAGVEPNPDKVKVILDLESPRNAKEVQRLAGKLSGLSRFLSQSGDKCSSFFKVLRGNQRFEWTAECEEAFQGLKRLLSQAPLLQSPKEGEDLALYLGVAEMGAEAVSSVLVREEGKKQLPIYYVSRILRKAELRYPILEKLAYALIVSARKLRPYFQAHTIRVVTDHPLRKIFEGVEHSGRLAKWSIELSEFTISFVPRLSIKAQAVADFLADYVVEVGEEEPRQQGAWKVMVDGASGKHSMGRGVVLAENEAVIAGLRLAKELEIQDVEVSTDSMVVASQIRGEFEAREPTLIKYLSKFVSEEFISFCAQLGIDLRFASVHHPRSNGQVEAANKIIVYLLKKKVENLRGNWVEQLPSVLWALRTTPNTATGETPFKLSHGCEAVLPVEFEVRSPRVAMAGEGDETWRLGNEEGLHLSLDMMEEAREVAIIRQEEIKRRMAKYFDKHVRIRQFVEGDLVLKKVDAAGRSAPVGKLNPNWEGPYIIKEVLRMGSYYLQAVEGRTLSHTWSGDDLRRFYP
ncbi:hypothetical protein KSP39_PZI014681 [Platanthera zijinensis]|uniref:Integrase catalytic domain-containing protein n=1 Tax=Platanthera zijinensis TaxID=2320716 RepID=A0AAP0BB61_9ASPA